MPITPPHHHTPSTPAPNPLTTLLTLQTHWHNTKRTSALPLRLFMLSLEVSALGAATLLAPTIIHALTLCFSELYELTDRRAHSPYAPRSWGSIGLALLLLGAWVLALARLAYIVDFEGDRGRARGQERGREHGADGPGTRGACVSWGRIAGRIIAPVLLFVLTGDFLLGVARRVVDPMVVIVGNGGMGLEVGVE
ncbi:hypothetical protein IAQ61_000658 [Plenodomus lingam]|uniref:uncharacterized protein n=1 Tax=Leptosphaeria maculans TaxID=5022 RepID=UPI0033341163|nr:hypothetical protein IAQ61_000658 [Plenodomus lingam]